MNKLFQEGARVSINGSMASLFPAGLDKVTVLYDDQRNNIVEKSVIQKAYREQKLILIDESGMDIDVDSLGQFDKKSMWRLAYVNAALALKKDYKSRPKIAAIINQVAANYPDMKKPSVSAVYNWLKKAESVSRVEIRSAVLEAKKRRSDSRVNSAINQLIFDTIDTYYMTADAPLISYAYSKFEEVYRKRFPNSNISKPHRSTFYLRIKELCPFERELKRKGRSAAKLMRRTAIKEMSANEILEQIQLDAVHLNIPVYDDEKNLLGTPVIHIAIDVYSRAVTGFSIELNSESSAGVIECIKNAVSIKLHEDHPYTVNKWIMYGKPLEVVTDGGSAYISESTTTVLAILNIVRGVNETNTPWHKAIVERFNLTLRLQFAALFKSYVGRKKDGRDLHTLKKYNEKVTLKQFRKILTCYIVDDYNQKPHSSLLKRTPHNVWQDSSELAPPVVPHTLSRALKLKGDTKTAVLNHVQGIRVNCVFYNSQELQDAYVAEYGQKISVKNVISFLYNPMDITNITVRMNNRLIEVPAYKADYPLCDGMSLAENKAKRIKAIERAEAENDKDQNFVDTSDRLKDLVYEGSVIENVKAGKKRGSSMPTDIINQKMRYSKERGELLTIEKQDDIELEGNQVDTKATLSRLVSEQGDEDNKNEQ